MDNFTRITYVVYMTYFFRSDRFDFDFFFLNSVRIYLDAGYLNVYGTFYKQ